MVLDYVKYQDVSSLVVFIEQNVDGEEYTEMGALELFGETKEVVDMGKLMAKNEERI